MIEQTECYDNISNIDICSNTYYICSPNCALSFLILFFAILWCCVVCCYYSFIKRKRRGIYEDLYTRDLEPQNLYTEPEYEDDRGLIIRGKNNFPPKYSEN